MRHHINVLGLLHMVWGVFAALAGVSLAILAAGTNAAVAAAAFVDSALRALSRRTSAPFHSPMRFATEPKCSAKTIATEVPLRPPRPLVVKRRAGGAAGNEILPMLPSCRHCLAPAVTIAARASRIPSSRAPLLGSTESAQT